MEEERSLTQPDILMNAGFSDDEVTSLLSHPEKIDHVIAHLNEEIERLNGQLSATQDEFTLKELNDQITGMKNQIEALNQVK